MTKYERKDYNEFGEKLEKRYKYVKDSVDNKDYDNILNSVNDYIDMSNAKNSFMDNLYFRDGLTTGITLMCEVFENNKNKEIKQLEKCHFISFLIVIIYSWNREVHIFSTFYKIDSRFNCGVFYL